MRTRAIPLSIWVLALTGCETLFMNAEERAGRRAALESISRPGVLGASMSAGFGTGRTMGDILNAAIRARHEVADTADPGYFRNAVEAGTKATAALRKGSCTIVIGLDYLFWFVYGRKPPGDRIRDLGEGLRLVEGFSCPIFLGDIPDMRGASEEMLSPSSIPSPGEIAAANREVETWARGRENVHILPLSAWMAAIREGKPIEMQGKPRIFTGAEVLQDDRLHPTEQGQLILAALCLERVQASEPGFRAKDFVLEPEKLGRKLTRLPSAVSIGVVSEDGSRLRYGHIRLECDPLWLLGRSISEQMALMAYRRLLEPRPLAAGNPLELGDLDGNFLTGSFTAGAEAPGHVPGEMVGFKLKPGGTVRLELVLRKARSLEVMVAGAETGNPIPGASVISRLEARERRIWPELPITRPGPGQAVTDGDGRAVLDGLRPGRHDIEVHARGRQASVLVDAEAGSPRALVARIAHLEAPRALQVLVLDDAGQGVKGMRITLRAAGDAGGWTVRTGAAGRAVLEGLEGREHTAEIGPEWMGFMRERKLHRVRGRPLVASRTVQPGAEKPAEIELGFIRGPATLEARAVDVRGRAAEGVKLTLYGPIGFEPGENPHGYSAISEGDTGAGGSFTFTHLDPGQYLLQAAGEDSMQVTAPGRAEATVGRPAAR